MKNISSTIKYSFILAGVFLLAGCSQSANSYFTKDPSYIQNAQYTKVIKIVDEKDVKAIANITYLNGSDSKNWNNGKQNFIISTYTTNEETKCCELELVINQKKSVQLDINNIEYETKVLKPLSSKVISKSDPLYKNIPFKNNWSEYRVVSYDEKEFTSKDFLFVYTDNEGNRVEKSFRKE